MFLRLSYTFNFCWINIFRASREVWPENEAFGAADADTEDEFMAMREILMADIPKPTGLSSAPTEDQPNEG